MGVTHKSLQHSRFRRTHPHLSEQSAVITDDLHETGVAFCRGARHPLNHRLQLRVRLHQLRLNLIRHAVPCHAMPCHATEKRKRRDVRRKTEQKESQQGKAKPKGIYTSQKKKRKGQSEGKKGTREAEPKRWSTGKKVTLRKR